MSGINVIIYYAPRAFELAGLYLIDKAGRKTLMYLGSVGYLISLFVVAWAFNIGQGGIVVFSVFMFIASHAVGQGQSPGSGTHWIFAVLITLFMPFFLEQYNPRTVLTFFAFMMILQLIFVFYLMPEIKGKSLENLSAKLFKKTEDNH